MKKILSALCFLSLFMVQPLVVTPSFAQSINPTEKSVSEQKLLETLKGEAISGRASIPDVKAATIIRPAGRDFVATTQGSIPKIAGYSILGVLLGLLAFYLFKGRIKIKGGASGKTLTRFNSLERINHWMTASAFILLGISGLNIVFGKGLLLPLLGDYTFSSLSIFLKLCHDFLAWPFMLGVLVMLVLWVKDNVPTGADVAWFKAGGGLLGGEHVAAKRFNGGQKLIFWSVIIGGAMLSISGLMMIFQGGFSATGLQSAVILHGITGAVLFAIMCAHGYIGSIGMEGAFDAMGSGEVDVNWAKEHHSEWAAQMAAKQ